MATVLPNSAGSEIAESETVLSVSSDATRDAAQSAPTTDGSLAGVSDKQTSRRDGISAHRRTSMRKERPSRRRSLLDEIAAEKNLTNPKPTGSDTSATSPPSEPHLNRRKSARDSSHPFLHDIVDESAEDELTEAQEADASQAYLSSPSLSLPGLHSLRASFGSAPSLYNAQQVSSPIRVPSVLDYDSGSLSGSRQFLRRGHKDHSMERNFSSPSLQRLGRKDSARASSTSWSPASAFLSQWSRDETANPSDPDDEGQELGDHGEYIIGRQIGYGAFSVVKEAITFESGSKVVRAVKIVRKQIAGQAEQENERAQAHFEHEVNIWRYLKHERILPLLAVFDSSFATFCITQINTSGTLFDLVLRHRRIGSRSASTSSANLRARGDIQPVARSQTENMNLSTSPPKSRAIPISLAARYIYQLACAIQYLHQDMRIVHRDIKLENCLVNTSPDLSSSVSSLNSSTGSILATPSEANPGDLLLCDFGMADFITRDDREANGDDASESAESAQSPHLLGSTNTTRDSGQRSSSQMSSNPGIGPSPHSTTVSTTIGIDGSLQYVAPEVLHAPTSIYETTVDIWAFGVTCYALLTSELPFTHGLQEKIVTLILEGKWDENRLRDCVRASLSAADTNDNGLMNTPGGSRNEETELDEVTMALELVQGCLTMDSEQRWDIDAVLNSPFVQSTQAKYGFE